MISPERMFDGASEGLRALCLSTHIPADQAHVAMDKLRYRQWATCLVAFAFLSTTAFAATYNVSSISQLNSQISSAVAGDTIILQNGVYTNNSSITVTKVGTAANPITIQAQTVGGVEIKGTS